ncbi:MAG: AAA family ATPase [Bacteroidales bacterium]|nr:AAA family ATPase [Bacteroidales bacterium]
MADPICRWRNPYVNTIVELVKALPHQEMPSDDFRTIIEERWPGFLHTPYQLACQMGLYYESEDGMYYPRFNHDIDENEARSYMERWIARYYVPNPYTKSMKTLQQPQPFLASIIRYVYNHPNETRLHSILEAVFQEKIGNIDIISNVLNTYTNLIKVDTLGNIELTDKAFDFMKQYIDRNDKKAFFENFSESNNAAKNLIFYGAPGTGKSHEVKKLTGELLDNGNEVDLPNVFRMTFHPDSDYSTFVGCYKPRMEDDKIKYEFSPQTFTDAYVKAWQNPDKQVYLVIEEINRGNCAQIFGDLFQLLDRKGGVSEYPINADADLRQYLEKEDVLGVGHEGIANGKLKLPANLNILATMNTSDQSLFPMDSAFKRRWSWESVPIDYNNVVSREFIITIGDKQYKWTTFLESVNKRIVKATDSEDKQMGNFFINDNVKERQFIDKVMFYLWNDVCKEEFHTTNNFFRNYTDDKKTETIEFSFNALFESNSTKLLQGFMEYLEVRADGDGSKNPDTEGNTESEAE